MACERWREVILYAFKKSIFRITPRELITSTIIKKGEKSSLSVVYLFQWLIFMHARAWSHLLQPAVSLFSFCCGSWQTTFKNGLFSCCFFFCFCPGPCLSGNYYQAINSTPRYSGTRNNRWKVWARARVPIPMCGRTGCWTGFSVHFFFFVCLLAFVTWWGMITRERFEREKKTRCVVSSFSGDTCCHIIWDENWSRFR